jgi:hypothetical protein
MKGLTMSHSTGKLALVAAVFSVLATVGSSPSIADVGQQELSQGWVTRDVSSGGYYGGGYGCYTYDGYGRFQTCSYGGAF